MAHTIRDVMQPDPVCVDSDSNLEMAARLMREAGIGDVLVVDPSNGALRGIVTDRDIVVRAIADGRDPSSTPVDAVCSGDPTCLRPDDTIDAAVQVMRDQAIRRLPVVEDSRPVGVVSIGDLALERDPGSALADISAAAPNN